MRRIGSAWPVAVVVLLLSQIAAMTARGDPLAIGYIYPAGGRTGTTFPVTVGVQGLKLVNPGDAGRVKAYVSGGGIDAGPDDYEVEFTKSCALRGIGKGYSYSADELGCTFGMTEAGSPRKMVENEVLSLLPKRSRPEANNKQGVPDTVFVKVTIAADAVPGKREFRIEAPDGDISNPIYFFVQDRLPEFVLESAALRVGTPAGSDHPASGFAVSGTVTLPAMVNGQVMRGQINRIRFKANKGARLVASAAARELVPYISDAVPSWLQAVLELRDPAGRSLMRVDNFRFNPDPVMFGEIPEDGEYAIWIYDAMYRGRENFVYRLSIGELPFVTDIFPLGVQAGKEASVEARGWNLPNDKCMLDARRMGVGVGQFSIANGKFVSNPRPFAVDDLPEIMEKEPNDTLDKAQKVTLPVIVNGRIDRAGDIDVFRFKGKAGQEIVAQVRARELGSPLDSGLSLTDAAGKELAFNDDFENPGAGLITHHADSYFRVKFPAGGVYFLQLRNMVRKGGPEYAYRLRLSSPRPDFELRFAPASVNIHCGEVLPVAVHAVRRDGFDGAIRLSLEGAPVGMKFIGATAIPAGGDAVRVTLLGPDKELEDPLSFSMTVQGEASIAGREVKRTAMPADHIQQAFFPPAPKHLVPFSQLALLVLPGGRGSSITAKVKAQGEAPSKLPSGAVGRILFDGLPADVGFDLDDPPEGLSVPEETAGDGKGLAVQVDAAKIKPGLKGNLIVRAFSRKPIETEKNGRKERKMTKIPIGLLPAIGFEVVEGK